MNRQQPDAIPGKDQVLHKLKAVDLVSDTGSESG